MFSQGWINRIYKTINAKIAGKTLNNQYKFWQQIHIKTRSSAKTNKEKSDWCKAPGMHELETSWWFSHILTGARANNRPNFLFHGPSQEGLMNSPARLVRGVRPSWRHDVKSARVCRVFKNGAGKLMLEFGLQTYFLCHWAFSEACFLG